MNDALQPWQVKYIRMLQAAVPEESIRKELGITMNMISSELKDNAAFYNAMSLAKSGVTTTMLSPAELGRILESQADDKLVAAYFGMKIGDMKKAIAGDEELLKVYETGRDKGKAKMLMSAYDKGLDGDSKMITHFLSFHNGMVEKKAEESKIQINMIENIDDAARKLAFIMQASNIIGNGKVIEGEVVEEELIVDLDEENVDN